jgi:histidinol phosphatase-like PHP family hydrolase
LSGISVKSIKQPSGSWKDIKLALSYPQTERNSLIPSTASVIYPNTNGKKDKSAVPDAIRIAEMLAKEIIEMEISSNASKPTRQSRAANLLIGENEHNLQNCNVGTDSYTTNQIRMMRSLDTGRGTKSLLGLETQNLEESKIRFKNPGLQNTQVEQLLNNQERKDKISRAKSSSHALLPIVRGFRKSEARKAYNTMYPLEDVDDYNQQTNIVLSQALSLNYSDNY